jgi:transposase
MRVRVDALERRRAESRAEISKAELTHVADAIRGGMSIRETANELGMSRSKVERLRRKAIDEGLLETIKPPGRRRALQRRLIEGQKMLGFPLDAV